MQKGEALRFSFLFSPVLAGIFTVFCSRTHFRFTGIFTVFCSRTLFPFLRSSLPVFRSRTQRREKFSAPKISVTEKPPAKPSARGLIFARAFFRRRSLMRIPRRFLRGRSFGLFAAQNDFRVNKKTVYVAKTPSRTQKNRLQRKNSLPKHKKSITKRGNSHRDQQKERRFLKNFALFDCRIN